MLSNNHFYSFLKKSFTTRSSKIGVIGLGYVGLPLLIRFVEEGYKTIGFDIDEEKIAKLNIGNSYIKHIPGKKIKGILKKSFIGTSDWMQISEVDVIIMCLPTPLKNDNVPNLQYILETLLMIKPYLKKGQLLVLESTTYPGTTEEELVPFAEQCGFNIGENFFIGYSPEREDPGNQNFTTRNIPKVVSGHTKVCLDVVKTLYDTIVDTIIPVTSTKIAEMTKILENVHRAVNIGLVNELKIIADKMNIDIYEVIDAASTKPFGFTPYYPGPGLGGHCIPIDPFYLSWKAKQFGVEARFIELAGFVNTAMPKWVIGKLDEALDKKSKSLKTARILVLGLAYKKNIDDTRESPSLELINILLERGAEVDYYDPYINEIPKTRKYNFFLKSVTLTPKKIASYDGIILATDHDEFEYDIIGKNGKLIVDTRGRFRRDHNVIRA